MAEIAPKRSGTGRALLWWGAAGVSCLAHVGAAALILREPQEILPSDEAPPAIMIEFAPLPEMVNVDETEIGETEQNVEEIEEQPEPEPIEEPVEDIEPEPEEIVEPDPLPEEIVEPEPEEEIVEIPDVKVNATVPTVRPVMRPKREEPRKEEERPRERPRPTPKPQAKPQQAQTRAASQAQPSTRNAAPQEAAGERASDASVARWQSRLMAHLERRKRYPNGARMRREQGTAHVNFTIDERGNVTSASLTRSSGFPELDQAVLDMLRRASPVPAPPPGVNRTITAPIHFTIR